MKSLGMICVMTKIDLRDEKQGLQLLADKARETEQKLLMQAEIQQAEISGSHTQQLLGLTSTDIAC